jgi:hypothetical protein
VPPSRNRADSFSATTLKVEYARHRFEHRFNIKLLSSATKVEILAATAQVEAWVGSHRGSMDAVARTIDKSLADAALGRMMLHRRRAVVATVLGDFFASIGNRFGRYLEGRAPQAPTDASREASTAKAAGDIVSDLSGAPLQLLFERALLAEADGRFSDAQADLQQLLAAYPGFLAAAIAAGRVALAAADPGQAIRSLASVEREVMHTREGAALLADAVRAAGLHEKASRYDLAALVCRGYHDSRGNDCAPLDVTGNVANDERMPQVFYFESQPDRNIICNSRGIYYRINPVFSHLLLALRRGQKLSTIRSLGAGKPPPRTPLIPELFHEAQARLRLLTGDRLPRKGDRRLLTADRLPQASMLRWSWKVLAAAWRPLRAVLVVCLSVIERLIGAFVVVLERVYRRSPVPVRAWINRVLRAQYQMLLPRFRYSIAPRIGPYGKWVKLSEISEQSERLLLAQARYQSGVAQIFGLPALAFGDGAADPDLNGLRPRSDPDAGAVSRHVGEPQTRAPGAFPSSAEDLLNRLLSEMDAGSGARPRS